MKILQITAHFKPNVGGVETHLSDLISYLAKNNWQVNVLTYSPLTTKTKWKLFESDKNISIFRIPWISGLFFKLIPYPTLEFIYLLPGLFLLTPFMLLTNRPNIIHAHGLVAGAVGVFWGKIFRIKTIISLHSIYTFPKKGLYRNFSKWIFDNSAHVLGLSDQSVQEIKSLGISDKKAGKFTYWIDMDKFNKIPDAKTKLSWQNKFVVLFVGRLIPEKGIKELLESSLLFDKSIYLTIAGVGPLEGTVKQYAKTNGKIIFLGRIDNQTLPIYYSASDVLIVPSVSEEGFGRVIIEALACGLPVVGAKRGAIHEAMDSSVGKLIDINPENIAKTINYFYSNPQELIKFSKNARSFATKRYSEENAEKIINQYCK